MKKKPKWKTLRERTGTPNVYRLTNVCEETGETEAPPLRYEARRLVKKDRTTSKVSECFADFASARAYSRTEKEVFEDEPKPKGIPEFMWDLFDRFVVNELDAGAASTKRTRLTRKRHLKFFLRRSVRVCDVTPEFIDKWCKRIRDPRYLRCQHSTRLTYREELKLLKIVLNYYRETYDFRFPMPILRRHVKKMVVRSKVVEEKKDLTGNEHSLLVEEIGRSVTQLRARVNGARDEASKRYFLEQWEIGRRVHVIARLQWPLAGRIQEIPVLKFEDVILGSMSVRVARRAVWIREAGGETFVEEGLKNGEGKIIPSEKACRIMLEWAMQEGIREGYLFFYKGKPISYRQLQYRYDKAFKALGLAKSGTHVVRHGVGTTAERIGGMKHAQKLLGHKRMSTTEGYVGVRDEDFKETVARMDDVPAAN